MLRSEVSPDFIPVDVPINLMIVAAWSVAGATSKTKQIPVVQIMMLKADDDDADPHDDLIEGVQLHLQPRQGQDLGRVAAVDSQLAQVGRQSLPSSRSSCIDTLVIVTILLTISISLLVLTLHSASSW